MCSTGRCVRPARSRTSRRREQGGGSQSPRSPTPWCGGSQTASPGVGAAGETGVSGGSPLTRTCSVPVLYWRRWDGRGALAQVPGAEGGTAWGVRACLRDSTIPRAGAPPSVCPAIPACFPLPLTWPHSPFSQGLTEDAYTPDLLSQRRDGIIARRVDVLRLVEGTHARIAAHR
jgi:hypothetical protein